MDRPVLCLKHEDEESVLLNIEYPPGDRGGPIKMDRQSLINELAFPRQSEKGVWLRLPARRPLLKDHEWALKHRRSCPQTG